MRILMVHDEDGWAFENISRHVRRVAAAQDSDRFEFRVLTREDWTGKPDVLWDMLEWSEVNFFFWRFDFAAAMDLLDTSAGKRDELVRMLSERVTITPVYDHLYTESNELEEMGNPFGFTDILCVSSPILWDEYTALPHMPDPQFLLVDGVDLDDFHPETDRDEIDPTAAIRVGWVGNSRWAENLSHDLKGFRTIFLPATERALKQGADIEIAVADRETAPLRKEAMPDFFRSLDIYVCTSMSEGTPNPVLEAMASGVAVLSTDVGVVRMVLGQIQQQMVLERDPNVFCFAIRELDKDRNLLSRLKVENTSRRDGLSWEARYRTWVDMFEHAESILQDPDRQSQKVAALKLAFDEKPSKLVRIRRLVFSNRLVFRIYTWMLKRHPRLLRMIRTRLRH